ncbi:Transcription factor bHLH30 [Orobanche minor]
MCDNNNNNNNRIENQENNISIDHNIEGFQPQDQTSNFPQMQQNINGFDGFFVDGGPGSTLAFPAEISSSQILPWNFPPAHHAFNPTHFPVRDPDPFILPPVPYGGLFNPRRPSGLHFGYETGSTSDHHHHHLRLISESLGQVVVHAGSTPFGLHAELQKMTAQEIMDAKALAASKSHSEAERRRRERINNHLAKLRSMLPSTTKTDKASLLAEVIQHVKELKRQTSLIAETSPVPTETDELTVDNASDEDGKPLIKASICCEDRSDLLPDIIKTLKDLRLKTLKAEITTLGGRVKNVLFITGDDESNSCNGDGGDRHERQQFCISSIEEALKAVMEKSMDGDESGSGSVKRQRTNINILEH